MRSGEVGYQPAAVTHPPSTELSPEDPSQQHLHLLSPGVSSAPFNSWGPQKIPLALITGGCSQGLSCIPPITPILDVDHPLGVGVAKVGAMWWPVVNLGAREQRVKQSEDPPPGLGMGLEMLTMLSSMGYVVLSGKMQVERQETTFCTPVS